MDGDEDIYLNIGKTKSFLPEIFHYGGTSPLSLRFTLIFLYELFLRHLDYGLHWMDMCDKIMGSILGMLLGGVALGEKIGSLLLGGSMFYISYHLAVTLKEIASKDFSPSYAIMWGIFIVISFSAALFQISGLFEKGGDKS